MRRWYVIAGIAGLVGAVACSDVLTVTNDNQPDINRALAKPSDVESLIGSSFNTVWQGTVGGSNDNINNQMMVLSFENSASLANFGFGARIGIPRPPISNAKGNSVASGNFQTFSLESRGARSAALGLSQFQKASFTIGTPAGDNRAKAFAYFVMGFGNANLGLTYDSAAVVTQFNADSTVPPLPLLGYDSVMKLALKQLDSAQKYAALMTTTLDNAWIPGNTMSSAQFVAFIRSYKARFRASVARTPTERAAVNWTAVRDDATNGITADVMMAMDPSKSWVYSWYVQHFLFDAWTRQSPIFLGMADSSGAYNAWLATPFFQRSAFLIRSADQRLPAGDTRDAQRLSSSVGTKQTPPRSNLYFRNRVDPDAPALPYTDSFYDWYRYQAFYDANRIGNFAMLQKAEVDLLAAEAYYRLGDYANAAAKINVTRLANGILPALTASAGTVPGGNACVPRVPDPATNFTSSKCGDMFEALKWEKRMELAFMQFGAWYLDSRGRGDLAKDTALQWPVPYQEMDTRAEKAYDQNTFAKTGTYGY